jgi:hypothetical protein
MPIFRDGTPEVNSKDSKTIADLPPDEVNVYLPSPEEIAAMMRQIRKENAVKETKEGGPAYLQMYRQPKVMRTNYSRGDTRSTRS